MIVAAEETRLRIGLVALLSFVILGVIFWGVFQIDVSFARLLRSLHINWVERLGDLGARLGSGAALVMISLGLLLAGWVRHRPDVQRVGLVSLLAHGVAALVVQALKHAIGRPRPRFMHADNRFPWHPSFESGLDSFPSGHTTASFAVATVLAKSFPRMAWPAYTIAGLVAISRAVRGSHFPTDVIAGICLGMVVGTAFAYPVRDWKRAILELIAQLLPFLVLIFSLLWLMTHVPFRVAALVMMVGGSILVTAGIGLRMARRINRLPSRPCLSEFTLPNSLIVLGLALTTGLWLIAVLAATLSLVQWLLNSEGGAPSSNLEASNTSSGSYQAVLAEIPLVAAVLGAVFTIQHLKGIFPIV